jgi:hypothetical protein
LKVDGVGVHVGVSVTIDTIGEGISLGVILAVFDMALATFDSVGVGVNVGVSVGVSVAVGVRVIVGVDVIVGVGVAGGAGMVCPRFTRKYPSVT